MSVPEPRFPRQVPNEPISGEWQSKMKANESDRLKTAVAVGFGLLASGFVAVAAWAVLWAVQNSQPLGIALALIVLGLTIATGYEACAVWPGSQLETISEIANRAFMAHRSAWVGIHLSTVLVVGLLTMHFTRLVQNQPEWGFLAATILVLINGALLAYWFEWLP